MAKASTATGTERRRAKMAEARSVRHRRYASEALQAVLAVLPKIRSW